MIGLKLNDRISVTVSDGFTELSEEQIKSMNGKPKNDNPAFQDVDRHIIVEMMWKKVPLLARIVSMDANIKATAMAYKERVPRYRDQTFLTSTAVGLEVKGFEYSYTVEGKDQCSRYMMLKHENVFYAFHIVVRKENAERDLPVLDEILNSVALD